MTFTLLLPHLATKLSNFVTLNICIYLNSERYKIYNDVRLLRNVILKSNKKRRIDHMNNRPIKVFVEKLPYVLTESTYLVLEAKY